MPGVYSRNKYCDAENWLGEQSLDGFERVVFIDGILNLQPLEAYEETLDIFWPAFIVDSTLI